MIDFVKDLFKKPKPISNVKQIADGDEGKPLLRLIEDMLENARSSDKENIREVFKTLIPYNMLSYSNFDAVPTPIGSKVEANEDGVRKFAKLFPLKFLSHPRFKLDDMPMVWTEEQDGYEESFLRHAEKKYRVCVLETCKALILDKRILSDIHDVLDNLKRVSGANNTKLSKMYFEVLFNDILRIFYEKDINVDKTTADTGAVYNLIKQRINALNNFLCSSDHSLRNDQDRKIVKELQEKLWFASHEKKVAEDSIYFFNDDFLEQIGNGDVVGLKDKIKQKKKDVESAFDNMKATADNNVSFRQKKSEILNRIPSVFSKMLDSERIGTDLPRKFFDDKIINIGETIKVPIGFVNAGIGYYNGSEDVNSYGENDDDRSKYPANVVMKNDSEFCDMLETELKDNNNIDNVELDHSLNEEDFGPKHFYYKNSHMVVPGAMTNVEKYYAQELKRRFSLFEKAYDLKIDSASEWMAEILPDMRLAFWLDEDQFAEVMESIIEGTKDIFDNINARDSFKENVFKEILSVTKTLSLKIRDYEKFNTIRNDVFDVIEKICNMSHQEDIKLNAIKSVVSGIERILSNTVETSVSMDAVREILNRASVLAISHSDNFSKLMNKVVDKKDIDTSDNKICENFFDEAQKWVLDDHNNQHNISVSKDRIQQQLSSFRNELLKIAKDKYEFISVARSLFAMTHYILERSNNQRGKMSEFSNLMQFANNCLKQKDTQAIIDCAKMYVPSVYLVKNRGVIVDRDYKQVLFATSADIPQSILDSIVTAFNNNQSPQGIDNFVNRYCYSVKNVAAEDTNGNMRADYFAGSNRLKKGDYEKNVNYIVAKKLSDGLKSLLADDRESFLKQFESINNSNLDLNQPYDVKVFNNIVANRAHKPNYVDIITTLINKYSELKTVFQTTTETVHGTVRSAFSVDLNHVDKKDILSAINVLEKYKDETINTAPVQTMRAVMNVAKINGNIERNDDFPEMSLSEILPNNNDSFFDDANGIINDTNIAFKGFRVNRDELIKNGISINPLFFQENRRLLADNDANIDDLHVSEFANEVINDTVRHIVRVTASAKQGGWTVGDVGQLTQYVKENGLTEVDIDDLFKICPVLLLKCDVNLIKFVAERVKFLKNQSYYESYISCFDKIYKRMRARVSEKNALTEKDSRISSQLFADALFAVFECEDLYQLKQIEDKFRDIGLEEIKDTLNQLAQNGLVDYNNKESKTEAKRSQITVKKSGSDGKDAFYTLNLLKTVPNGSKENVDESLKRFFLKPDLNTKTVFGDDIDNECPVVMDSQKGDHKIILDNTVDELGITHNKELPIELKRNIKGNGVEGSADYKELKEKYSLSLPSNDNKVIKIIIDKKSSNDCNITVDGKKLYLPDIRFDDVEKLLQAVVMWQRVFGCKDGVQLERDIRYIQQQLSKSNSFYSDIKGIYSKMKLASCEDICRLLRNKEYNEVFPIDEERMDLILSLAEFKKNYFINDKKQQQLCTKFIDELTRKQELGQQLSVRQKDCKSLLSFISPLLSVVSDLSFLKTANSAYLSDDDEEDLDDEIDIAEDKMSKVVLPSKNNQKKKNKVQKKHEEDLDDEIDIAEDEMSKVASPSKNNQKKKNKVQKKHEYNDDSDSLIDDLFGDNDDAKDVENIDDVKQLFAPKKRPKNVKTQEHASDEYNIFDLFGKGHVYNQNNQNSQPFQSNSGGYLADIFDKKYNNYTNNRIFANQRRQQLFQQHYNTNVLRQGYNNMNLLNNLSNGMNYTYNAYQPANIYNSNGYLNNLDYGNARYNGSL